MEYMNVCVLLFAGGKSGLCVSRDFKVGEGDVSSETVGEGGGEAMRGSFNSS